VANILVIEDEDSIAAVLDFLLTRDGHRHDRLRSGAGALDTMRELRPELVLLDTSLPVTSGFDVLKEIRSDECLRGTKVLMLVSQGSVVERKKSLILGANGILSKPFKGSEVKIAVNLLM
jgi:two-component system, OmpR family, phosphate regulon response regulator PhoB